jgi:hypothetical protein
MVLFSKPAARKVSSGDIATLLTPESTVPASWSAYPNYVSHDWIYEQVPIGSRVKSVNLPSVPVKDVADVPFGNVSDLCFREWNGLIREHKDTRLPVLAEILSIYGELETADKAVSTRQRYKKHERSP